MCIRDRDRLEALFKKPEEYTILEGSPFKGSTLVGKKYQPLFPYFAHLKSTEPDKGTFRIVRYGCNMQCQGYQPLIVIV